MHTRIVFVCAFIGTWFVLSAIRLGALLLPRGSGDTSAIVDGFLAESYGRGVLADGSNGNQVTRNRRIWPFATTLRRSTTVGYATTMSSALQPC